MLITTAFDFPGYDILAVQGEIFGITVRARNIGAGCVAGLRSLFGGEIPEFTKLLGRAGTRRWRGWSRTTRVQDVSMRSTRSDRQWSEICAYGTGVWVKPVTDIATAQYDALVASGQLPHQDTYRLRVSEWSPTATIPGEPAR